MDDSLRSTNFSLLLPTHSLSTGSGVNLALFIRPDVPCFVFVLVPKFIFLGSRSYWHGQCTRYSLCRGPNTTKTNRQRIRLFPSGDRPSISAVTISLDLDLTLFVLLLSFRSFGQAVVSVSGTCLLLVLTVVSNFGVGLVLCPTRNHT
ncbi:hypothetical protein K438DRAFT_1846505 [Mycena galopus ATCC 62051]|nr:hypothetical protein K438DRAFT_1846505 [Mycena galopus ATCC 62051]